MNVTLREVTPDNFRRCIDLKVADSQAKFVASNLMSIAQAKIYPTAVPLAIYAGEEMVGFAMYGFDTEDQRFYLVRLMIDEQHQRKRYGRAAALEVIERMRKIEACREIFLSFVPENTGAEKLYQSIGFERTGEISEHGEVIMRYSMTNKPNPESQI